jgi:hypothetical protein
MGAGISSSASSTWANAPIPLAVRAVVVLGALLLMIGTGVALFHPVLLVSPRDEINGAVHIYAGYFASRNLGLAIVLLIALAFRAKTALGSLLIFAGAIQWIDAVMDCVEQRWAVAPGVTILGTIFFLAAMRLSGYPFWRAEAWGQSR